MPRKRIYDQHGGVVSVIEHDDLHNKTTFAQYQDFTPYFERNKVQQNEGPQDFQGKWGRKVASIPNVLMLKWLRDDGIQPVNYFRNPKAYKVWLRRKIYSSDNSFVLTSPHKATA